MHSVKPDSVPVWDLFIRIFHWSLVTLFSIAYILEDDWITLHSYAGYAISILIVLRLIWGVIGSRYARFSQFVTGPEKIKAYLRSLLSYRPQHFTGHNPAGGAMVILLLISLTLLCVSGIVTLAGEGEGPFANYAIAVWMSDWMEDLHELLANLCLGLIFVHVAGVLVSSLLHKENLIRAMITGKKQPPPST